MSKGNANIVDCCIKVEKTKMQRPNIKFFLFMNLKLKYNKAKARPALIAILK